MTREEAIKQLNNHTYGYKFEWLLKNCKDIKKTLEEAEKRAYIYAKCKYDSQ